MLLLIIIGLAALAFCDELRKQRIRNTQINQARELARIAKEQERQAKEQERFDREQERQAQELSKQEQRLDNLYFKIEKAEDEILHFSELAERLEEQRDAIQEEIAEIDRQLEHAGGELNPLNARYDERFDGEDGAELFMDMYASTLDGSAQSKKQKQADAEKLRKRRETLQGKIIKLDNQIFTAEQRIKKANYERDAAHNQLGA